MRVTAPAPLPHSLEAEEFVLSGIMLDDGPALEQCITAGITTCSFYDPKHAEVFAAAVDLHERGEAPGAAEIAEELKRSRKLETIGGYAMLAQVSVRIPTTAQLPFWIKTVRDLEVQRDAIKVAVSLRERLSAPAVDLAEVLGDARATLEELEGGVSAPVISRLGKPISAAALCDHPPATPPERISGILYGSGTMMLSGPSKSRKTYTFLDLAVSVAAGAPWLGFKTTRCPVIYLNLELAAHSLHKRIAAICQAKSTTPPDTLHVFNLRGSGVTVGTLHVDLPKAIRDHGAGLVIVDPWYKISARSGVEENSNDAQAQVLDEMERIVTTNGAALVLGHHFSKGDASAKNAIDRAAGAGAMSRWGDCIATMTEHEEEDCMSLEFFLRDFAPVSPSVIRWNLPLWQRDDTLDPGKLKKAGRTDDHPASELLKKLLDGMSNKEWEDASEWAEGTYRRKRDQLIKERKVRFSGGCYYRNTP